MAGDLQRQIRLHRTADLDRPAGKHRPAAVIALLVEHVRGAFPGPFRLTLAEERQQQDVFRFQDRVALQFGAPVAVGMLEAQQVIARPFNRGCQTHRDGCGVHGWPRR